MTHQEMRLVMDLRRELQDAKLKVVWHERETQRLRRLAASTERLEQELAAKTRTLEFSIKRQEVLRKQLSAALGTGCRPAFYLERKEWQT